MNIRRYLLETLNSPKLLNLLADRRVYFLHAETPKTPYLEYEIVSEYGTEYSEGKEDYTTYIVQVDIFSRTNYSEIEEVLKQVMKNNGFNRSGGADLYEEKTKLYHKALRFNISLENE